MRQLTDAWLEHQRRRFTRHDAQRWWRCDAVRYQRFDPRFQRGRTQFDDKAWPERSPDEFDREWQLALHRAQLQHAQLRHEWALLRNEPLGKSWEDQPRVPPGSPEGGQWTSSEGQNEPQILSDATPGSNQARRPLAQRHRHEDHFRARHPRKMPGSQSLRCGPMPRSDEFRRLIRIGGRGKQVSPFRTVSKGISPAPKRGRKRPRRAFGNSLENLMASC